MRKLKFYIIVSNTYDTHRLQRIVKDNCEWWAHYIKNMWFVATARPREELTDLLWEKNCIMPVIETTCESVHGYLEISGWSWLAKVNNVIKLSEMNTPSLTDMYELGRFDELMSCSHCIRDIDGILDLYKESARSPFELESVRNRMIERLTDKIIKDNMRLA